MKNYAGTPFQFQIGDSAYTMQELGFSDAARVVGIGDELKADPEKAVAAIHDLVKAKSDTRTADAVLGLPPAQGARAAARLGGSDAGGIQDLWRRVTRRRAEVTADFRSIYHCSLYDPSLREVRDLVHQLAANPQSRFVAAEQGWARPVSWEWLLLADLYDLQRATASRLRSRPYPRPTTKRTKLGGTGKRRSIREVLSILRPDRGTPPE